MENFNFGTKPTRMIYILSVMVLLFFKGFCTPFNGVCASIETSAYLTLVITSQPSDMTVTYGDAASFSVTATGPEPITYQWQLDAGSGFTDINNGGIYSGVTTATLNISLPIYSMNGYKYKVIVNPGGSPSLTSNFATLTVNKRAITITADSKSKFWGEIDPPLTFKITSGNVFNMSDFSGNLIRDDHMNEHVGTYAILQGTLALNSNYTLTYVGNHLTITPLPVTVTADPKFKVPGAADPPLTFVSSPAVGTVMANGAVISFTGSLSRAPGEAVGIYPIDQSTLYNSNYIITYHGANLTITMATAITPVLQGELGLKIYPNPFTDRLYFELRLNKNDDIRLEIFDIIGTRLSTLLDDQIEADKLYMLEYVPVNISSGLLIYRLELDGRIFIGKVLYQK